MERMRKLELKCWLFYITFLVMLLLATGCKTKHVDLTKEISKKESEIDSKQLVDNQVNSVNQTQLNEKELKELLQILSSLNINFDGKTLDDKLDVLLKRTNDGTMLSIAGIGTANYKEDYQYDYSKFEKQLFKRQDSLFNQLKFDIIQSQEYAYEKHFKKDKEVEVTGGQSGLYITIGIILIILIILAWIAKRFKVFDIKKPSDI
jgi:hypothetical protein